uniref:HECT domain-containing protein n=1 Tax=Astyanax mexicanus TaxID=7994 RepID=A0A3B1JYT2_ASTMX
LSLIIIETPSLCIKHVKSSSCLISLAGCSRKITFTNKEEVCTELAEWYMLQRTRAQYERFRDGLQCLGVLDAIRKYPERFREVFMKTATPLTAAAVENLFQCRMAERGSNRFERQCHTLGYWRDYLQDAEGKKAVTLEEILVFTTGCDSIPPLGFSPLPSLDQYFGDNILRAISYRVFLWIMIFLVYIYITVSTLHINQKFLKQFVDFEITNSDFYTQNC